MNRTTKKSILAFVAGMTVFSMLILLGAGAISQQQVRSITKTQVIESALDTVEADTLKFVREEEKMARDVYDAMYEKYKDLSIFDQISESEQEHMDAILTMLKKYGLPDPALEPGVFDNQLIQVLYNDLVNWGNKSEIDALEVGAYIEEYDILDLKEAIEETDHSDLDQVYGNLELGSENHLRAFVGLIEEETGETYDPKLLPTWLYEEIMAASGSGKRTQNQHR